MQYMPIFHLLTNSKGLGQRESRVRSLSNTVQKERKPSKNENSSKGSYYRQTDRYII